MRPLTSGPGLRLCVTHHGSEVTGAHSRVITLLTSGEIASLLSAIRGLIINTSYPELWGQPLLSSPLTLPWLIWHYIITSPRHINYIRDIKLKFLARRQNCRSTIKYILPFCIFCIFLFLISISIISRSVDKERKYFRDQIQWMLPVDDVWGD